MSVERGMPEPLVLAPSGTHESTIILLHGRGRKANVFATEMAVLRQAHPHAKLIFPWAPKRRATVYKKSITRQWFDDWHLDPDLQSTDVVHSRYDEGLQMSGLGETVAYLHALIDEEARLVGGAQNVALGGFSQGAAASLVAALLWDRQQRLGGVVAMCAWLPYMSQMAQLVQTDDGKATCCMADGVQGQDGADFFDPFERAPCPEDEDDQDSHGIQLVLAWLRDQIDVPQTKKRSVCQREDLGQTPFLLCHSLDDDKVAPQRSQNAAEFLRSLGLHSVERKIYYSGIGHETCAVMIADIAAFFLSAFKSDTAQQSVD